MSKTNKFLKQRLQSRIHSKKKSTFLRLETRRGKQGLKPISGAAYWLSNNFVACDRCFTFNPQERIQISYSYLKNICPECGNKGVRYLSTASNKLFDYVSRNIY